MAKKETSNAPNRLKELRRKRRLKSVEVARMMGLTAQHYGRIERGKSKLLERWIIALSRILGVPQHELFNEGDPHSTFSQRPTTDAIYTGLSEAPVFGGGLYTPIRPTVPLLDAPILRANLFRQTLPPGVHRLRQVGRPPHSTGDADYAFLVGPKGAGPRRGDVVFLDSIPYIEDKTDTVVCVPHSAPDRWFLSVPKTGVSVEQTLQVMKLPSDADDYDIYRVQDVIAGQKLFKLRG